MNRERHPGSSDDFAAIAELAEHFTALVDALCADADAGITPARIVTLAEGAVPGSHYVGIIAWTDGRLRSIAASNSVLLELDEIRAATGEGPALDAIEGNDLVFSDDLADDPRWPRFGPQVGERTGIRSLVCYRLCLARRHRAALTFCSTWPHGFTDLAIEIGAIFAAYSSMSMLADVLHDDSLTTNAHANVHREIGVAIGILMTRNDMDSRTAYHRLHRASRELNRSLSDTAADVIRTGRLTM